MRLLSVSLIAAGLALAQAPRLSSIEFYGLRKVSEERLRSAVGVREGDPLPSSKADIEERVEKVPGVLQARVEAVCCSGAGAVLYIGIEERDAPHVEFRPTPAGDASLPPAVADTYRDYLSYFGEAARSGSPTGPAADAYRENLAHLAAQYWKVCRRTLLESDDVDQRSIAAALMGYAPLEKAVVDDLQRAMLDPEQAVRAASMRSLESLAVRAAQDPDAEVRVELTWFIELLNSLDWDDRHEASLALVRLTQKRDPRVIDQLRERALRSLLDMCRWRTPEHAYPGFVLLGRIAGLPEAEIEQAWKRGDKDAVVRKALGRD